MRFILALIMIMAIAVPASADVIFNNFSAYSGTAVKSTPVNVAAARIKTVQVTGIAVAGHTATTLSGTFLLECGPTKTGPFVTCKDQAGNATTTTSNTIFNIDDSVLWMRGSWAKTAGEVKAWLNYK